MKNKEVTIKDLAELLLPKLWIVVIFSIIASGIAFVCSHFLKDDTYTASSKFYVNSTTDVAQEKTTGDNIVVARYMLENYKLILKSERFLKHVVDIIKTDDNYKEYRNLTVDQISRMMSISHYEDTEVFTISVTSADPKLSCLILKLVHDVATGNQMPEVVETAAIFKITALENPTEPEAYASIPQNSKHEVRNAVLAFMVAAVVSVVSIWIYSFFDVVIRDKKKLIDNVDVPILGVIPRHELTAVNAKGEGKHA